MAIAIDVAIAVAIDRDKRLCLSWKVFLKNEMEGPVRGTVDTNCGILWNIRTMYLYIYIWDLACPVAGGQEMTEMVLRPDISVETTLECHC